MAFYVVGYRFIHYALFGAIRSAIALPAYGPVIGEGGCPVRPLYIYIRALCGGCSRGIGHPFSEQRVGWC